MDRMNLKQIRLDHQRINDLPRLLADKEKIKIALLNIVINAVEAMSPGLGVLTIRVERTPGMMILYVIDNGKGIPPDDLEKLFDPFFTSKEGGMGLGLTSTRNILTSHGATVEVTSKVNEGTTFAIYFRLAE